MATTPYATLADAKVETKATSTLDDNVLLSYIRTVSNRIDRLLYSNRAFFAPVIETRQFMLTSDNVWSAVNAFRFSDNLLAATGVTVNGTDYVGSTEGYPIYPTPFNALRLTTTVSWYNIGCVSNWRSPVYVTIAGVWGYHSDYNNAWLDVDTITTVGGINASVTTFTVTDVDGLNAYGLTPRLSAGALIRVDSEFMEVTATNITTNTVTVRRGVNGSTAAIHAESATVAMFQVEDNIRRVVARQAAFLYARRGSYENASVTDMAVVSFPSDLLGELIGVMNSYAYT